MATKFRDKGWATLISPYYVDSATDKAREIDLIAEKVYSAPSDDAPKKIRVRFYIECKYVKESVVFWFGSADEERTLKWISANASPFKSNQRLTREHHHYLQARSEVARLFASAGKKGEENDPIFRALNQCLNGYLFHKDKFDTEPLIPRERGEQARVLQYPVIICSGFSKFFRTDMYGDQKASEIGDNFLLEVNYAYKHEELQKRGYFLLDVVSDEKLDAFLDAIDNEVEGAKLLFGN